MATPKKAPDTEFAGLSADEALEETQYQQYVRELIESRLKSVDAGEVISHEEAKKRMAKWLQD